MCLTPCDQLILDLSLHPCNDIGGVHVSMSDKVFTSPGSSQSLHMVILVWVKLH